MLYFVGRVGGVVAGNDAVVTLDREAAIIALAKAYGSTDGETQVSLEEFRADHRITGDTSPIYAVLRDENCLFPAGIDRVGMLEEHYDSMESPHLEAMFRSVEKANPGMLS